MPSPFPGMDSYLESRSLWKGVHDSLVYRMLEDLQPQLQPRYLAVLEGRLLLQPLDQFSPAEGFRAGWSDVSVQEETRPGPSAVSTAVLPSPATPDIASPVRPDLK